MIDSIKIVWSKIPKKILFSILAFLIGYIGKLALDYYILDETINISEQVFQNLIYGGVILLVYFVASFLFYSLSEISELKEEIREYQLGSSRRDSNESIKPKKQKKIPREFEIDKITDKALEFTVVVKRSWYPDKPPGVEDFLDNVNISKPRCGECKSDFYTGIVT